MTDQKSCPNCEFEKGKPGRPVLRGENIHCLDCGTSWKDITANSVPLLQDNSREKTFAEMRAMLRQTTNQNRMDDEAYVSNSQFANTIDMPEHLEEYTSPGHTAIFAAIALFVFISVSGLSPFFYWNSDKEDTAQQVVSLTDIELKERIGRAGKKVITVKGLVENGTGEYQALRPIAIILRRKDGGEIIRWRHVSQRPVLKAGARTRFSSSIQYDTPLVAYAEAVFE